MECLTADITVGGSKAEQTDGEKSAADAATEPTAASKPAVKRSLKKTATAHGNYCLIQFRLTSAIAHYLCMRRVMVYCQCISWGRISGNTWEYLGRRGVLNHAYKIQWLPL